MVTARKGIDQVAARGAHLDDFLAAFTFWAAERFTNQ
jgi:hypothetical protein